MHPLAAAALVALLYVLHQDVWFWRAAHPLVFGFIPVGLFYHAAFTAACSIVMWLLVKRAWPAHLDPSTSREIPSRAGPPRADSRRE
jgi:hypothetical protein